MECRRQFVVSRFLSVPTSAGTGRRLLSNASAYLYHRANDVDTARNGLLNQYAEMKHMNPAASSSSDSNQFQLFLCAE